MTRLHTGLCLDYVIWRIKSVVKILERSGILLSPWKTQLVDQVEENAFCDLPVKQCSALYVWERTGAIAQVDFREWILREHHDKSSVKRRFFRWITRKQGWTYYRCQVHLSWNEFFLFFYLFYYIWKFVIFFIALQNNCNTSMHMLFELHVLFDSDFLKQIFDWITSFSLSFNRVY